jgi:hypothetical protein
MIETNCSDRPSENTFQICHNKKLNTNYIFKTKSWMQQTSMEATENLLKLCKGTHTEHLRDNPQADKRISTSNSKMSVAM